MEITSTTTNTTSTATGKLFENYEAFLQLLTVQLQNQDPLDPMDTAEYTNQLVQYASVEQQIETNDSLDELKSLTVTNTGTIALSFVGSTAEIDSQYASMSEGVVEWNYTLDTAAESVQLTVSDENGDVVYEVTGEATASAHNFVWDSGDTSSNGIYSLVVSALDSEGEYIDTKVTGKGQITGVATGDNTVTYYLGDLEVDSDLLIALSQEE